MTRISTLLVTTTLAILPISAFAQPAAAPAKDAAPIGMTNAARTAPASVTSPSNDKTTTTVIQPNKPNVKAVGPLAKPQVHSMNGANPHRAKTPVAAKTVEPAKS